MEQKIRLCFYGPENFAAAQAVSTALFQGESAPQAAFYETAEDLRAAVAACINAGETAAVAAPPAQYTATKIRLIQAFNCKAVKNRAILTVLEGSALPPKQQELQAAVPAGATVYPAPQGKFSAFAMPLGNGRLVFLPADPALIAALPPEFLQTEFPAPQPAAEADSPSVQMARSLRTVLAAGKRIAIAETESAALLTRVLLSAPQAEDVFLPTKVKPLKHYKGPETAGYAKAAKEAADTALGIAISAPQTNAEGETVVTVSVADSNCAKVREVIAAGEPSPRQLTADAILQLCLLMDELSAQETLTPPENAQPAAATSARKPLLFVGLGIAAALILCLVLVFIMRGRSDAITRNYGTNVAGQQDAAESALLEDDGPRSGGSGLVDDDVPAYYFDANTGRPVSDSSFTGAVRSLVTTVVQVTAGTSANSTTGATIRSLFGNPTTAATTRAATTTAVTVTAGTTFVINPPLSATVSTTKGSSTTTTTTKASTTKAVTSVKAGDPGADKGVTGNTVNENVTVPEGSAGVFVFRTYGWGHGVGMSQQGAVKMARNGNSYEEILQHYYPGTTLKTDNETPTIIKYGGTEIPIVEYLCRSTKKEIGEESPVDALKAQLIVIYTYAKYEKFDVKSSLHAYAKNWDYRSEEGKKLYNACLEILNMSSESDTPNAIYVDYNGKTACTSYFDTAAGRTASASSVWGNESSRYPYLTGGVTSPESVDVSVRTFTAEDMRARIESYAKSKGITIKLSDNPANWLEILEHDSSYSSNIGYVTTIRVGDYQLSGNSFRTYLLGLNSIRSHCFTLDYVSA